MAVRRALTSAAWAAAAAAPSSAPDLRRFVMETKTWSVKAHLQKAEEKHGAASKAALTDEDVEKVADYAHLNLPPRGSPEFERIKEDLSSVLAASAGVRDFLTQRSGHVSEGVSGDEKLHHEQIHPRSSLGPEDTEQLADARTSELRVDDPREGQGAEALLKHAAKRSGQFFVVPRTVEG